MKDFVIVLVILLMIGLAAGYVIRAKKRGQKCIGCPHAKSCAAKGCCSGN